MKIIIWQPFMIFFTSLIINVQSQCTSYYDQNFLPNQGAVQVQQHQIDLQIQQTIVMGFWMTYRPLIGENLPQNPQVIESMEEKELFIFSFEEINSDIISILMYSEFLFEQQKIFHHIILQTDTGIKRLKEPMDYDQYEGTWFFVYCLIDQQHSSISLNHYNFNTQQLTQQVVSGYLLLFKDMQSITGGYKNVQIDEIINFHFQSFPGQIQPIILGFEDYFITKFEEFIAQCYPEYPCRSFYETIIEFNNQMTDKYIKQSYEFQSNSYVLKGWIKQDQLINYNHLETVLFRISNTDDYLSDNSQIGDKILYVVYFQDKQNPQENGFSLQTYSYKQPWKSNIYIPDQSDTILVKGEQYKDLLIQWHYFQFEFGTISNHGQPIYKVYYASTNTIEEYVWKNKINHFTSQDLYFSIGGDDYSNNIFKGYLSDWILNQYCSNEDVQFVPQCHYTCLTCKGISEIECLSCDESSFRVYSQLQGTCKCQYGKIDKLNQMQCVEFYQYNGAFKLEEKELIKQDQGFYKQDQCEFGYFQYNNSCIKCPYEVQETQIRCADCILYPDTFSSKLNCTFLLNSTDQQSVFHYYLLNSQEQELYEVQQTIQQKYILKSRKGYKTNNVCKDGYFLNENEYCQECIENCEICKDSFSCTKCQDEYLNENGTCVKCQNCVHIIEETLVQGTFKLTFCPESMYMKEEQCYDCGKYCKKCSEKSCYICNDDEKYFITIDSFNCAECQIENCQYCFQYYITKDQTIITSLDIDIQSEFKYTEIKTACALCKNNFFFSFETYKCELKPIEMIYCQSGVYLENQSPICLVSNTMIDAVQQPICNDPQCQSCIKKYSQRYQTYCVVCNEGYYSSFYSGQCKQCPQFCQKCAEFNLLQNDQWKSNIRAFYEFFINKNKDHAFETHQKSYLKIICLTCLQSYTLSQNRCLKGCSDTCSKCQVIDNMKQKLQFRCNECKPDSFNLQRSVISGLESSCLTCPNFCSACLARSPEEIKTLNPFFNQNSSFLKYSHICYFAETNKLEGSVSILPQYIVPNICQHYAKCEKIFKVSYNLYCDYVAFYAAYDAEQNQYQKSKYQIFQFTMLYNYLLTSFTQDLFLQLNEVRITEIQFDVQIVILEGNSPCLMNFEGGNITHYSKENVFTLQQSKIVFRNSQQSYIPKLPLTIMTQYKIINFNKISFIEIEFQIFEPQQYVYPEPITNISFINDYDAIILQFENCNIVQNFWLKFAQLTFYSKFMKQLSIQTMTMKTLQISNSSIFNIQPYPNYLEALQEIQQLLIVNSNFTNTSIFIFKADNYSLNQVVKFKNVTILNTNFSSSFFLNSTFLYDQTIGEISLEDFNLENVTFVDHSICFQIFSSKQFVVQRFFINNVKFLDQSSFIFCDLLNINDILISNSMIYFGNFIHITQKTQIRRYGIMNKNISLSRIRLINNTYSNSNSFIFILQDELTKYDLICSHLLLDNNVLLDSELGKSSFNYFFYKQSLIYIECQKCYFENLIIQRGVGLPEISISDSEWLHIDQLHIETNKQYYKRSLHSSVECSKQFIYLDIPFVLYVYSYLNVHIDRALIQNTMVGDFEVIILVGKSRTESLYKEKITLSNSIFQNNILLIMNENRKSSLLSIETLQDSEINIQNVEFNCNFLNQFYQSILDHSSVTLLINADKGKILFQSLLFYNNILTNSSDSVLYVLAKSLIIQNCRFFKQNILTHNIFRKNILSLLNTTMENIAIYFKIYSLGGNGYIETNQLLLKNTQIQSSLAVNGGGFYITTLTDGIILVDNCSFQNTSTILNGNQISSGGLFFIDSSKSILKLTIQNTQIASAYSRTFGGAIYIEPSRQSNQIVLDNLIINSVFSIQHSFLSFSPKKQIIIFSSIVITNSRFQNTPEHFDNFLSKITDLQEQNIFLFQTNNPLISVSFSNLTILNCEFFNINEASLVEVEQGFQINLQQINALNGTIFQSSLIKLSLSPEINGVILLKNILISNMKQFKSKIFVDCLQNAKIQQVLLCPKVFSDINSPLYINEEQKNLSNQINCNFNLLYQIIQTQQFSLLDLNKFNDNHIIYIQDLTITDIGCENCYYGIVSIKDIPSQLNLNIENIQMINNQCGIIGCLSIIKSIKDLFITQKQMVSNILKQGSPQGVFNITLKQSIFKNNLASYGGACFLSQINILINNSIFESNTASYYGGSIYYESEKTILQINNSKIVKNQAQIGGGIYLQNYQLQQIDQSNLILEENSGLVYANNLYETPRFLNLSLDKQNFIKSQQIFNNSSMIIEKILIDPYQTFLQKTNILLLPSGISIKKYQFFNFQTNSYVPFNLSLRLQASNILGEKLLNLENTECLISAQLINNVHQVNYEQFLIRDDNQNQFISNSAIKFDKNTGDYNLDDLIINFNPYQEAEIQLQLAFQCDSIIVPFYNSTFNQPSNQITKYILLLNLRTFKCQLGEFFNLTSGGCTLCDITQSQYSVTINATQCSYQDQIKISDIKAAMIKLRPNYWRAFYYSEIIEACHNLLSNCEGGWFSGNPSCAIGHIGALCEQCDLYNIKGQGEFSQNQSYQCTSCDQTASNILNIIFVIIWTLVSLFITVTSTIKMIDDYVFQLKLKPLGFFPVVQSASTSALLKVLTNYFQILISIASFQLQIPKGITFTVKGVGNPIGSVIFSLDCYLKFISSIPIIYLKIVWGFAIAGIYIFLFFSFHLITIVLYKKQFNITLVTTTFIYIYIYLSPNLVSDLTFLISFRNISGQQWIAGNVAYLYNTDIHMNWLIYFISPTFLIIGILLPFFFWYIVYHHRLYLNNTKTRKMWGYLYNEYKLSTYYWETLKILQKELIILILIYYEDYVAIKACLIFFLLHLYSKLTSKLKPYLTNNLNQIDLLSTSVCKISIVLAQSIFLAQGFKIKEVIWPFYIVIVIINLYFIIIMTTKLLFAYFDKLYQQIDKIRVLIQQYIPFKLRRNKLCLKLLENTTERKFIVRMRYKKLRNYLINQAKLIIDFKNQNNMGLQSNDTNYCHQTLVNLQSQVFSHISHRN